NHGLDVSAAVAHAVSMPVGNMPEFHEHREPQDKPLRLIPQPSGSEQPDTALQTSVGSSVPTISGLGFAGVGNGDYGFVPDAAPPDTNGAVGLTQYVQWVNESFAVFEKTAGLLLKGPVAGNTLFTNLGGG